MTKLIRNWDELAKVPPNSKYKIFVKDYSGWIIPINDELDHKQDFKCNCKSMDMDKYFKEHVYLSTHTFYGSNYEYSTKILQEHGFDVEIDNWDK